MKFFLILSALFTVAPHAHAQSQYPAKPIRVLVPFAPGGSAEVFARLTTQRLQER